MGIRDISKGVMMVSKMCSMASGVEVLAGSGVLSLRATGYCGVLSWVTKLYYNKNIWALTVREGAVCSAISIGAVWRT